MIKRLECKIYGYVQMVSFRDFTRIMADKTGVVGTVQNMPDGSVYIITEGEKEQLNKFLATLHKGTTLARVDRIEEKWSEPVGEFSLFKII